MKRLVLILLLAAGCWKTPQPPVVPSNCLRSHNVLTGAYVCDPAYNTGHVCHRYVPEIQTVCDEFAKERPAP